LGVRGLTSWLPTKHTWDCSYFLRPPAHPGFYLEFWSVLFATSWRKLDENLTLLTLLGHNGILADMNGTLREPGRDVLGWLAGTA